MKIIGKGNSSCTKGHVPDNKHVIGLYGAYIMAMVGRLALQNEWCSFINLVL